MIAYFDCAAGAGGDMLLSALVDAGAPAADVIGILKRLPLRGVNVGFSPTTRRGFRALRLDIASTGTSAALNGHRAPAAFMSMLDESPLPPSVRHTAARVIRRLADAEAEAHGSRGPAFHELASPDTLIDVVGVAAALEFLGVRRLACSPVNVGAGRANTSHGPLPLPSPAAAVLLRGMHIYSDGTPAELVTPTGAAILSTICTSHGPLPPMQLHSIGVGAGGADLPIPNILRVFVGRPAAPGLTDHARDRYETDEVVEIAAGIDDMSPELFPPLFDRLFSAGALDVAVTPCLMKKGRPGHLLKVLAPPAEAERLVETVLLHSTSFGVRTRVAHRIKLPRSTRAVPTRWGDIPVKLAILDGEVVQASPEFDECRRLAEQAGVPAAAVFRAALAAAEELVSRRRDRPPRS